MAVQLPPCPASLRPIQHYLKTASEHDGRDAVIGYWCRLYALQSALKIDKKSDEAKILLVSLMDWLEKEKKNLSDNEAITNDVAAQAHIENYALKLFLWADGQDRAGQFNKNVVKAFYTAGFLMDVLTTFGEQTDEIQQNCKYAKWKAAYIHNCLRNGETPVPGPAGGEEEAPSTSAGGSSQPSLGFENLGGPENPMPSNTSMNNPPSYDMPTPSSGASFHLPSPPTSNTHLPTPSPSPMPGAPYTPTPSPSPMPAAPYTPTTSFTAAPTPTPSADGLSKSYNGVELSAEQIAKASKYCKWAGSALNYDDVPEAVGNLQKALVLLTTGQDC